MKYFKKNNSKRIIICLSALFLLIFFTSIANAGPKTKYYQDLDGDTYGNPDVWVRDTSPPPGYVLDNSDCDDTNPNTNPGATEICADGVDNNCNGQIDEGCGGGTETYYFDGDNDTYGDPDIWVEDISPPAGYVLDNSDCDDTDPDVNPGAIEICGNGIDEDCNGEDPACSAGKSKKYYYNDVDGDTYGDPNDFVISKNPPAGYVNNNVDCDDTDPNVNPSASEVCGDGVDNNCDGQIDEGCVYRYYHDADSDTYGDINVWIDDPSTTPPAGYVADSSDCDDTDPNINPGVAEICDDGIDNNCDGQIDEWCPTTRLVPEEYQTISSAIADSNPGDTILVNDGTYGGFGIGSNDDIIVTSVNGPASTIIDANIGSIGGSGVGLYDTNSTVNGFSIINATDSGVQIINTPYNNLTSPTVSNCIISNNISTYGYGGGIRIEFASPNVIDTTIGGNSAYQEGGGVHYFAHNYMSGTYMEEKGPDFINCNIVNNTSRLGGGVYSYSHHSPHMTFTNTIISDNVANSTVGGEGGGLYSIICAPTFINCNIVDNTAVSVAGSLGNGGGYYCTGDDMQDTYPPVFINTTISGNTAEAFGGGLYFDWYYNNQQSGPALALNSIIYGNSATVDGGDLFITTELELNYCDFDDTKVTGIWTGANNINANPMFIGSGDYHLSIITSPCVDSGTSVGAPTDDIDGESRPKGGDFDIGSDEF